MNKLISFVVLCLLFTGHALAADDIQKMEKMSDQLEQAGQRIDKGQFEGDDLSAWNKLSIKLKSEASLCAANNEAALADLKTEMEGLGEKVEGEDAEVTRKREANQKEKEAWQILTHMEVSGQATDHEALSSFVRRVLRQPQIGDVRILNTQQQVDRDKTVVDFKLVIMVNSGYTNS